MALAPLPRADPAGGIASPPAAGRAPRIARAVVVAAAVVAGLSLLIGQPPEVIVLAAPADDHVDARLLEDGTPVWATSSGDAVAVLQALGPVRGPVGGLVGWCAAVGRYVDPHLGLSFAPDGRRHSVRVPGRLPRDIDTTAGLLRRDTRAEPGFRAGDPVRVAATPTPLGVVADSPLGGGEQSTGPPAGCRLASRRLEDTPDPAATDGLADHAHLARPLDPSRDGWQIAAGWIRVDPADRERPMAWCTGTLTERLAAECRPTAVPVDLPAVEVPPAGVVTVVGDPLAVRLAGGRIVDIAVLPSSTWAGSSLAGTITHRLGLLGRDPTGSRLLVTAGPDRGCVSPAPRMAGADPGTQAVYVDIDTVVALRQAATTIEIPPPGGDPLPVEVVLDEVTCRTLLVRDG